MQKKTLLKNYCNRGQQGRYTEFNSYFNKDKQKFITKEKNERGSVDRKLGKGDFKDGGFLPN
jgi:hypothetical protein